MDLNSKATVLVVDSATDNLVLLKEMLHGHYHVKLAGTGADALRMVQLSPLPDLILLDGTLPDMEGHAVFRELRGAFLTADIPVIMLVGAGCADEERRAFIDGANDVIAKPLLPEPLLARVAMHIELHALRASHKRDSGQLEYLVAERTREAVATQDATILAMATLAETRDSETSKHVRRTQRFLAALARELRFHRRYAAALTDADIALMTKAAPLHDIGKVGIPDTILLKPGQLTAEEFEIMKRHTEIGRDAIEEVERSLGGTTPFLRHAREIIHSHHEKWDGRGYPQGLKGEQIPLSARLMAVADVYDALISKRVYKPAFTHETAMELIRQARGEHFDPDIVDAMLVIEDKFRAIAADLRDTE